MLLDAQLIYDLKNKCYNNKTGIMYYIRVWIYIYIYVLKPLGFFLVFYVCIKILCFYRNYIAQ